MPRAPMVVALHGFTGSSESWNPVRRVVSSSIRFQAPPLPGHAGVDHPVDPTWTWADAVSSLGEGIRRWVRSAGAPALLVGYSLGARLGLGLLRSYPSLFRAAMLIGVRAGLDPAERDARVIRDDALAGRLEREDLEAFVDVWQGLPLFASQQSLPRAVLDDQRRIRLRHDPKGLAWALRALGPGRMPDFRPLLSSLELPIQVLVGEHDTRFQTQAETLANALPHGRCVIVPGVGHNPILEAPDAIGRAIHDLNRMTTKETEI